MHPNKDVILSNRLRVSKEAQNSEMSSVLLFVFLFDLLAINRITLPKDSHCIFFKKRKYSSPAFDQQNPSF